MGDSTRPPTSDANGQEWWSRAERLLSTSAGLAGCINADVPQDIRADYGKSIYLLTQDVLRELSEFAP